MPAYKTKIIPFTGSNYKEIRRKAYDFYIDIKHKSKRKPYVRSAFFKKEKIFIDLFWSHLYEKNYWDQVRRMQYFACGIELIRKSHFEPSSKENPNKRNEVLHRFLGITPHNEIFFVQIKEVKTTGKKFLISIFPFETKKEKTFR